MSSSQGDPRGERGQVLPVVAVTLVFAGLLGVAVVHLGASSARRSAAQDAADASALAGAADGPAAARHVAAANDAQLLSITTIGHDVVVRVRRRGVEATARARWSAGPLPHLRDRPGPDDRSPPVGPSGMAGDGGARRPVP